MCDAVSLTKIKLLFAVYSTYGLHFLATRNASGKYGKFIGVRQAAKKENRRLQTRCNQFSGVYLEDIKVALGVVISERLHQNYALICQS